MADARRTNLARLLVDYSTKVKPGDWVLVFSDLLAMPLAEEVVRSVIQAGGNPNLMVESEGVQEIILKESSQEQLQWISPLEKLVVDQADVVISLDASSNTRTLTGVDPEKQQQRQVARKGLNQKYLQRAAEGSLRWVLTQYPCPAYAQEADMSLSEFEDFVYAATYADQPDPVKRWQEIHEQQQRLVDWLEGKEEVIVQGPNAELSLSIAGRKFINSDGTHNMPSGEIFTGPVEDSANGWIRFTYPAISGGREVEGVELEFDAGKVVRAEAKKNQAYLHKMLDSDEGARYLGEFAVGTNYAIQRFTKSILYDEKIGGSIHLAVGAGYPETGSRNQSSIHWDFICDMRDDSEIHVDGELFYKNGKFQV